MNKQNVGFISNKNISNILLLKLQISPNFFNKENSFFNFFSFTEENLDEITASNLRDILMKVDFRVIPKFDLFLNDKIFNSKNKTFLYNKLFAYVQENLEDYKKYYYELSEREVESYINEFKFFKKMLESPNNKDEKSRILYNSLDNEISRIIINNNNYI